MYMFGEEPLRAELSENAFEATSEPGGLTPRLVIAGKYSDRTHARGYLGTVGVWQLRTRRGMSGSGWWATAAEPPESAP